jgi:Ca-activated chloride channel homolog
VRNATGQSTTVTQPLPLPEGVSDAAVGGAVARSVAYAPPPMQKTMAPAAAAAEQAVQDSLARREKAKSAAGVRITALSGITGTSDPAALRGELEARLLDPALASALAGLPAGTVLALKVDATGQVVSASFSRAFPGAERARTLLKVWRLRSWTGGLAGSLELTLG